jgi:hypothetical protein
LNPRFSLTICLALFRNYSKFNSNFFREIHIPPDFKIIIMLQKKSQDIVAHSLKEVFIGTLYILLCLIIGEDHPFSRVEMYNSFPKTSHSFFLCSTNGKVIPLKNFFHYSSENLTHNYNAICQSLQGKVPENELAHKAGKMLWLQIKPYQYRDLELDSIQICELTFAYDLNKLKLTPQVLDEEALKRN